jgi:hypothetical protein
MNNQNIQQQQQQKISKVDTGREEKSEISELIDSHNTSKCARERLGWIHKTSLSSVKHKLNK